jgi:excisionase family DNA binding protein
MTETREIEATSLLTVAEAAELARFSKPHIWRLIWRDEIEAVRIRGPRPDPHPARRVLALALRRRRRGVGMSPRYKSQYERE